MKHPKPLSDSVDEYLEEMYRLQMEKREITTKELAERLNISMPSVSEMLPKLSGRKFIEYKPRGEIRLTSKGMNSGGSVYKKFETLRKFLMRLGFDEKKAGKEACKLEHAVSEEVREKIENCLRVNAVC